MRELVKLGDKETEIHACNSSLHFINTWQQHHQADSLHKVVFNLVTEGGWALVTTSVHRMHR